MNAAILSFTLAVLLPTLPVSGQQPTPKPEMPPWNGAVFADAVTDVTMHVDVLSVRTYICPPKTTIEKFCNRIPERDARHAAY